MRTRTNDSKVMPVMEFMAAGFSQERELRHRLATGIAQRVARLRELGLSVAASRDFRDLVEAPARVGETTLRMPLVDPDCQSHLDDGTAFWIGAWREDTLVATTAVRLRHVPVSLREEMESLRFFFDDTTRIPPDTWCRVEAPSARIISGLVMCSVSVWTARSESGQGLAETVSQLAKLIGVGQWDPDHLIGFSLVEMLRRFAFHKYWHSTAELGFMLSAPGFRPPETACLLVTSRQDFREQRLGVQGLAPVRPVSGPALDGVAAMAVGD